MTTSMTANHIRLEILGKKEGLRLWKRHCVVPENIHTPTTEDFLICTPPPPRIFRSRGVFHDPPSPQEFPEFFYL